MAEEQKAKVILEREYIVPLRREWLKVPTYKRANKAVKALKQFIAKHMKVYDRDLRKIKINILLNNEIRFRGMKKPCAKIKVKAIKYDNDTVEVKLVNLPKHIEFEIARTARKQAENLKKETGKEEAKPEEIKKEDKTATEKKDEKEKIASSKEAELKIEKDAAKQAKHMSGVKKEPIIQRKSLKK
jgi:large subunit ribosomal protein L31e